MISSRKMFNTDHVCCYVIEMSMERQQEQCGHKAYPYYTVSLLGFVSNNPIELLCQWTEAVPWGELDIAFA